MSFSANLLAQPMMPGAQSPVGILPTANNPNASASAIARPIYNPMQQQMGIRMMTPYPPGYWPTGFQVAPQPIPYQQLTLNQQPSQNQHNQGGMVQYLIQQGNQNILKSDTVCFMLSKFYT